MLSSFLSRIFWVAFIIIGLRGIGDIISQVTQKPLIIKSSKNSWWTLGKPGLIFSTRITNRQNEKNAPDTSIIYSYFSKSGENIGGEGTINNSQFNAYKKYLDSIINDSKINGGELKIDTQVTLIGETQWNQFNYSQATGGIDSVNPNKFIFRKTYQDEKGKITKEEKDSFTTQADAKKFMYLNNYKTSFEIVEEINAEQSLRVLPQNKWQQLWFLLFKLIQIISFALLFLSLSNLFRNFSKHYLFTFKNIRLLKKIGWYILIPQIVIIIFYWTILFRIHPAKIFFSIKNIEETKLLIQYEFESGINWQLIFIGLSILVLSYIFKDGLKLKEEQALTV